MAAAAWCNTDWTTDSAWRSSFFIVLLISCERTGRTQLYVPSSVFFFFFLLLPQKCSFFSVLQSCGSTRQPTRRCNFSSGRSQRRVERSLRCSTHAGAAAAIVYMPAVTSCLGPNWSLMVVLPISPPIWLQLAGNCLHWSFYNWIFINAWNMRILCIIVSKLIIIDLKWWQLNAGEPQSHLKKLSNRIRCRVPLKITSRSIAVV